jgi:hypothetical protein
MARRRARIVAFWAAALLALALVFAAYLNPHVMVSLANQLWACF